MDVYFYHFVPAFHKPWCGTDLQCWPFHLGVTWVCCSFRMGKVVQFFFHYCLHGTQSEVLSNHSYWCHPSTKTGRLTKDPGPSWTLYGGLCSERALGKNSWAIRTKKYLQRYPSQRGTAVPDNEVIEHHQPPRWSSLKLNFWMLAVSMVQC